MEAFPETKEIQEQTAQLDQEFETMMRKEFAKYQNSMVKERRLDKKKKRLAKKQSRPKKK